MSKLRKLIKNCINNNYSVVKFLNWFLLRNKFILSKKSGNRCNINRLLKKSKISVIGSGNSINIKTINGMSHIYIYINGNNNNIYIDENVVCLNTVIWIEDDNNNIYVGKGTSFTGKIQLSAIEGTSIKIGQNCLFSSGIDIRTGDGHSVLNLKGERINKSSDIEIADKVWCGKQVSILKGVRIPQNSVIAIGSIVTKTIEIPNSIIAGVPAKVVKSNINWDYTRI